MPIERELSKILALPATDLIRWREEAREILADHGDAQLPALYEASGQEVVKRADEAWSAAAVG